MEHFGIKMKKSNLTKKQINKIVKELEPLIIKLYFHDDLICPNCLRDVPNKNWFTDKGCIWCDGNYHRRNNVKKTKVGKLPLTSRG